jgi:biopolymer transport protein ExbD
VRSSSSEFRDEDVQHQTPLPVVPLIDCFVLILVFFLTCASVTKPHKEVGIVLPNSAAAAKAVAKHTTLIIEVASDGTLLYEREPITGQLLQKKLREAAAENKDRRIRIDGDRRVALQHIVHLLDICQFEGLNNVGIRTRD